MTATATTINHQAGLDLSSPCCPWTGYVNPEGYGLLPAEYRDGKRNWGEFAHRAAWEQAYGPIPEGLQIDHACHNADPDCPGGSCRHRACISPRHLQAVTPAENRRRARVQRMARMARQAERDAVAS